MLKIFAKYKNKKGEVHYGAVAKYIFSQKTHAKTQ